MEGGVSGVGGQVGGVPFQNNAKNLDPMDLDFLSCFKRENPIL